MPEAQVAAKIFTICRIVFASATVLELKSTWAGCFSSGGKQAHPIMGAAIRFRFSGLQATFSS
jgi:hypothetical protein